MGGYIKLDKDLGDDPRLIALAGVVADQLLMFHRLSDDVNSGNAAVTSQDVLGVTLASLVGGLYRLWCYADQHVDSHDNVTLSVTGASRIMGLPPWIVGLYPSCWLRFSEDGRTLNLPGYCNKNNVTPRDARRLSGAERTRRWREKHAKQSPSQRNVTAASHPPSQTTSARRHGDATPVPVPGPGPIDLDPSAPLTSGRGRIAGHPEADRSAKPATNGKHPPTPAKTPEQLRADACKLAATGLTEREVHRMLSQHGATPEQVAEWLARPSEKTA